MQLAAASAWAVSPTDAMTLRQTTLTDAYRDESFSMGIPLLGVVLVDIRRTGGWPLRLPACFGELPMMSCPTSPLFWNM
jgi:hypothetical protein